MGLVGVWLAKWLRIPHLYDMHSSLPQQLSNFKYSRSASLRAMFNWMEDQMVHKSDVVITICQELQDTVIGMGVADRSLLIENVMGGDVDEPPSRSAQQVRSAWGIGVNAPLALYTGTFEAYQGVEMLIDHFLEPGFDVAPNVDQAQVGPTIESLRPAARAAGGHRGAGGQIIE